VIKLRNDLFRRFHYVVWCASDTSNIGQHYIWPAYYLNPFVKFGFPSSIDSRRAIVYWNIVQDF
jgi:hypothetical protein